MPKMNTTNRLDEQRNQQRKMGFPSCCFKLQKSMSPPLPSSSKIQYYPSRINTTTPHTITVNTNTPYSGRNYPYTPDSATLSPTTPTLANSSSARSPTHASKEYRLRTHDLGNKPRDVTDMLLSRGYIRQKRIAATLQGEVFAAVHISLLVRGYIHDITCSPLHTHLIYDICYMYYYGRVVTKASHYNRRVAIKTADKALHHEGVSLSQSGIKHKVHENIVKEAELMAVFMAHNPPKSLIKYYDFFEDECMYYLVMEKAGIGLLDFTKHCHKRIRQGRLAVAKYRSYVRFIFAKMTQVTAWMHNTMNCCHLDISLENVVMAEDTYFDETGELQNLGIRFIDFGLTEMFRKTRRKESDFVCTKYVGKTGYKAPSVYHKVPYYAKKADIWSLGHCLFMLSIGSPLYKRPTVKDAGFKVLKCGQVDTLLKHWNRFHYVTNKQYDLMMKMLCINPRQRLSIKDVMNHDWMKPYFQMRDTRNCKSISSAQPLSPLTAALRISLSSTSQYDGGNYCVVDRYCNHN